MTTSPNSSSGSGPMGVPSATASVSPPMAETTWRATVIIASTIVRAVAIHGWRMLLGGGFGRETRSMSSGHRNAMARRNAKKQAIMKAVNLMAGKNEVAEMAQSNAVLFGATSGKAHHKDRIIALRQEHGWTPKSNCCWHNSSPSRCTSRIGSAS